jgi:hypothetical protein
MGAIKYEQMMDAFWCKVRTEATVHTIKIEVNLTDPFAVMAAFSRFYSKVHARHGVVAAQTMVQMHLMTDLEVNDLRNAEWMLRFRRSGLSQKKFAAELAAENKRLVKDSKEPPDEEEDDDAIWEAMGRAQWDRLQRGPWGSTEAGTIVNHMRKLKKRPAPELTSGHFPIRARD